MAVWEIYIHALNLTSFSYSVLCVDLWAIFYLKFKRWNNINTAYDAWHVNRSPSPSPPSQTVQHCQCVMSAFSSITQFSIVSLESLSIVNYRLSSHCSMCSMNDSISWTMSYGIFNANGLVISISRVNTHWILKFTFAYFN